MGKQRPPWPDDYYSLLRKEGNFGCAKCGKPIVTIHHIEGFTEGVLEKPEGLIVLCDYHHKEADEGKIKKDDLYLLKRNPFNVDTVKHKLMVSSAKDFGVHIGSNEFYETPIPLQIYGKPIISIKIENEAILLSANFFDENDKLTLSIRENFWEANTDVADVRYSENQGNTDSWVSVKMKDSEPYLNFKISNGNAYIDGKFYARGNLFDVNDNGVFVLNQQQLTMMGCTMRRCHVGLSIG